MEWTQERVDTLKRLWMDGLSARQIAEKLGGVTRNAVIGKAHRIGLSSRPSPIRRTPATITPIKERSCQWPIGHPRDPDFHFCHQPAEQGKPYCSAHCVQAYRRASEDAA